MQQNFLAIMFNTRFSELYLNNYSRMLRIAKVYVPEHEEAENIVHDVFAHVWEQRDHVLNMDNVEGYMAVSLKNKCLDYLKHLLHVADYADYFTESLHNELTMKINSLSIFDVAASYDNEIINNAIRKAIDELPPRCREVFLYSRRDHLKNSEIAERMGIAQNTVEAQMTIAIRKLRVALAPYIPLASNNNKAKKSEQTKKS